MNAKQEVATRPERSPAAKADGQVSLRPVVDIFENDHAITLLADLPGVGEQDLSLEVDDKTLSIEGELKLPVPERMQSLHADVRATRYRRAFTLSSELDSSGIEASLRDGLLTVTIPKREEVRPRKIEIAAG